MTTLKSRLHEDLTAAIKARDEVRSATIRMALAAVTKEEVAGKEARELSDEEVLAVLTSESKKRREAAEAFTDGGREEQAARERAEGAVLEEYLPAQLTDEELTALVDEAVAEARAGGAEGPKAMGAVMKLLKPRTAGRADGKRLAAEVKRRLS
ncbi:GatB/YqeY domain-containing protein [Streptomyces xiaopingdaonensis]|uniref:GatB/YqeY domain-containing protein n=1 Tax=Streptomyces xiaopingdaonensis TaxID=1565415 RepID=UPI000374D72D|nr:GatB/YqeY domain-containing protein [Streptomyces xiaopingdaonensis]